MLGQGHNRDITFRKDDKDRSQTRTLLYKKVHLRIIRDEVWTSNFLKQQWI